MNDTQFERNLQSVGLDLFVEFYREFADDSISASDIIEKIFQSKGYTEKSCRSRTSHARSIISQGRGIEGLRRAADSRRVDINQRQVAEELITEIQSC